MNKNIKTEIAIGIIIAIALIIGSVIWVLSKQTIKISETQPVAVKNKIQKESIPLPQQNSNLTSEQDTQVPKRFSGTGCYKKEADGTDNEYEFRKDFNVNTPTTTVKYSNVEKGISFDMPFNPNWGNKDCVVKPYAEFKQPSGDILVEFGRPRAWITSEFTLTISKQRTAEDIIAEQKNVGGEPKSNPRKKIIGNKTMVVYESYGMGTERIYEVIGKDYNYSFSHSDADTLADSSIKSLENIIASVEIKSTKYIVSSTVG